MEDHSYARSAGMMSEPSTNRVKCRNAECSNTILPTTAAANGGLCAPCMLRIKQEEHEEFIRVNRREVNPYARLSDPVEIIKVFHAQRKYDPLVVYAPAPKSIEELYGDLSERDAIRLMNVAAASLRTGDRNYAATIAQYLATLTDYRLDDLLTAFILEADLWPGIIFRAAGASIRDALIKALEDGQANPNHALSALAWIGDEVVQKRFQEWDTQSASWRSQLFIKPSEYSRVAGWELALGKRRNLYHSQCFALIPVEVESSVDVPVAVMREIDEQCPWCRRNLVHLIDVDSSDRRFVFLRNSSQRLSVLTCDACTCYTTIFGSLGADGQAKWSEYNTRPEYLPKDTRNWLASPWREAAISFRPRRAIEAADWCMGLSCTQIGGLPSWVQDPSYPACPSCKQSMLNIGQVDNGAFPGCEGIYYAFLCGACEITATLYQQS